MDEELFAEVIGAVDLGVHVYQVDDPLDPGALQLVYANSASVAATGIEPHEAVGKSIRAALPILNDSQLPDSFLDIALGGDPAELGNVEHQDGDEVTPAPVFSVHAFPLPQGRVGVSFTNVTAQRRAEQHAVQTLESMRQAQRLETVGRVTAGVAHDFSNLLTAIRAFANLGEVAPAELEKTARYFAEIDSAAEKAVLLTRQLLAVGRPPESAPTRTDLNDVVLEFRSLLRHLVPPEIELQLDLATEPVPVFVDRSQLEQVILNLVVNGRDAIADEGKITIRTSTDAPSSLSDDVESASANSAWLQVIDTGDGIPDEIEELIFEPFFSTKPPETGTGLGLATIDGIVSESRGDIYVDSTVGRGTTMTVALPADAPLS